MIIEYSIINTNIIHKLLIFKNYHQLMFKIFNKHTKKIKRNYKIVEQQLKIIIAVKC